MTSREGLDAVLQRAERLIRSCDEWPPERPPSSPAVFASGGGAKDREQQPQGPVEKAHPSSALAPPHFQDLGAVVPQKYSTGSGDLVVPTSSTSETAVLIDGLERENQLLRLQLDRCFAREKQLRADVEQLKNQQEESDLRSAKYLESEHQASTQDMARIRAEATRSAARVEELAAQLADAERREAVQAQSAKGLQWQVDHAQANLESFTKDIKSLQQSLLPSLEAQTWSSKNGHDADGAAEQTGLEKAIKQARLALNNLCMVVEAKIETLDLIRQQLRGQLEEKAASTREEGRTGTETGQLRSTEVLLNTSSRDTNVSRYHAETKPLNNSSPSPSRFRHPVVQLQGPVAGGIRRMHQSSNDAVDESQTIKEIHKTSADERQKSERLAEQLKEVENAHKSALEDAEACRRALRVKEAEVRQLQLLGKYFPTKGQLTTREMDLAQMVDGLREHCQQLESGKDSLQARCDVLQAERDMALTSSTRAPSAGELRDASEGRYPDLAIVQKILEQKKAQHSDST